MSNLALQYRPRLFGEVLGQASQRWVLQSLVAQNVSGRPFPSAILLAGPSGTGKTSLARIVGRALNCATPAAGEPCLACASCVQSFAGGHPAIVEIDAANCASADDARELVSRVAAAHPFPHLVFILDECHAMSRQAWDVLLRTIEACPPGVTFVFCTTSPDRLRTEVLSRVYRFDLTTPPNSHSAERLQQVASHSGRDVSLEVCFDLVRRSRGNLRSAYNLLEQVLLHPDSDPEAVLGKGRYGIDLLEAAINRDRVGGIRLLSEAWDHYGNAPEVYADWMEALEQLLLARYDEQIDEDPATAQRLRDLSSGYPDTLIAVGMETVSDWAKSGGRRASLSFAWAAFLKAISGPTVVDSMAIGEARKKSRKATALDFSNFQI